MAPTTVGPMAGDSTASQQKKYRFGLIPKQRRSPFFQEVESGCVDRARKINVECVYEGPWSTDLQAQIDLIRNMTMSKSIDGIAISAISAVSPELFDAISFAQENGVPIVTFDSDAAGSERRSYIGTDNRDFGSHLAKVLEQIDPTGGYYGIISGSGSNAKEREEGIRTRLEESNWVELPTSPKLAEEDENIAIQRMIEFAPHVRAIVSVGGWPMRNTTIWMNFIDKYGENITTVCADTLPHQMEMLNRGYVTGLVGQVPFQMGATAMNVLLSYQDENNGQLVPTEIFGTSFQEVLTVPSNLPPAVVDMNYIGKLALAGYAMAGIVSVASILCALWTMFYQKHKVVKASQPFFLIMISAGVLILSLSIIPMTMDDGNGMIDMTAEKPGYGACMSQIWLVSVGFTTVFTALFSKTWRINRIFRNPNMFTRLVVRPVDVLAPFVALMTANVLVLVVYTAVAPLEYKRLSHPGTDDWNRIISTYGICQSSKDQNAWIFPVALAMINMGALCFALVQAYQARRIQSEFSESQYIAIVMGSLFQTLVTACPVLFLVRESPKVLYMMKVVVVFAISSVILVCIFAPKVTAVHFLESNQQSRQRTVRITFGHNSSRSTLDGRSSRDGLKIAESSFENVELAD